MPLRTAPELLSTVVQNMTKYGLGWFLGMCRKVLDHLSQKYFFCLVSETFHPNPLCNVSLSLAEGQKTAKTAVKHQFSALQVKLPKYQTRLRRI